MSAEDLGTALLFGLLYLGAAWWGLIAFFFVLAFERLLRLECECSRGRVIVIHPHLW